jgi:trimeric autotransporter adhesin
MRNGTISSILHPSNYPSLWLLAAAICLCPAAAQALDPTNTATGTAALASVTSGQYNTADGHYALNANTTGRGNTASGSGALARNTTGYYNTACGVEALFSNTTGRNNVAVGVYALYSNTTGAYNTASGFEALFSNTIGVGNTANGYNALYSNTTGEENTASGAAALYANTTGKGNTASGSQALASNTTGQKNTAYGSYALYFNTTASNNTASGNLALYANTTGSDNVAVGGSALFKINGANNIALGTNAGKNTTSGNYNIYIGHTGRESRVIRIGQRQTKTFIDGIAGVPLSGATVVVRSNGQLGVVASSARYKQDVKPLGSAAEKLARLRPVSYRYKTEPQAKHSGLIAEEVDKVMPELVVRDEQNRPESVQYLEIIPLLLQDRRKQQVRIEKQELELTRQRELIERLQARLESRLDRQAAELAELRSTRLADNKATKN